MRPDLIGALTTHPRSSIGDGGLLARGVLSSRESPLGGTAMARRTLLPVALTLAVGLAGCDSSPSVLPATPTSTALPVASPPTPPAVPAGSWNLTTTLTSATGPQQCAVDISHMHVGESYADWLLTIDRSGESVHLVVSDLRTPSQQYEYQGTVVGDLLAATIRNPPGAAW